ncbi:YraN family protein [Actinopolyspora sp. H202]|uniref:YraN family protein n=1 Tax=Actinopolyspora sp. H202 TaxID=1500456 RepID=UPI003EE634EC
MRSKPIIGAVSDDDTHGRRHALGRAGEQLAAEYLRQRGLVVLSRNWSCSQGELDIVCTDGRRVIVCEVKTRSGIDYGSPVEAVSPHKVRKLREVAAAWLRAHDVRNCPVRFDVLSVLWPPDSPVRIEHHEEVC